MPAVTITQQYRIIIDITVITKVKNPHNTIIKK